MLGLTRALFAALLAATAAQAQLACNGIDACSGKAIDDECSWNTACDGGSNRPVAVGTCRPGIEDPEGSADSPIWCKAEW